MFSFFLLLIIGFLIFVATRPSDFRYTRTTTINAPASAVFPHVNDFHQWGAWSPWEKVDPMTKKTYGGPSSGVGATYAWLGNSKVGSGHMTIIESRPHDLLRVTIEFIKPMKATNTIEFTFAENAGQTLVTHSMFGCNSFMGKAMGIFMNMDKMIGDQFEKGLASLKEIAEV